VTFRRRLALASAAAVAAAVAVTSVAVWFIVRSELRGQVDESLVQRAGFLHRIAIPVEGTRLPDEPPGPGEPAVLLQVVTPEGEVLSMEGAPVLAVPKAVSGGEPVFAETRAGGIHFRVYAQRSAEGYTIMLARPLTEVDDTLRRLVIVMLFVMAGGVAIAAGLGLVVTRAAAAPVARLSDAAERVTETGDLSLRIEEPGSDDEVGRLASRFNAMLAALESSVASQRQLVADASHELRTPLTSIRTNIDVLASGAELAPAERERLLSDLRMQLEELTALVNDVVELARGAEQPPAFEDVRLDAVVRDAIQRFEARTPEARVLAELEPVTITGDAARISRAVGNLLDNAAKWTGDGREIEVTVTTAGIAVRDHGPGFAEEDLPRVFDRFYRAADARGLPGSGLGLAIVRQVAETHGGRAVAENHPDGGGVVRLELQASPQEALAQDEPVSDRPGGDTDQEGGRDGG
jgi:two-component system sensor histidine kinase MprB